MKTFAEPTAVPSINASPSLNTLRRACDCAGKEDCDCEEGGMQRSAEGPSAASSVPPIVRNVLGSGGQPLEASTRNSFESKFGVDFGSVRIHTGDEAARSARAVNASAYTVGRDIVFGHGRYAPDKKDGEQLLAHELAHVVQQRGAAAPAADEISSPNDAAELEADRIAREVTDK
jgi:hypothetical protein